jgi:LacI family transcriptional regulator
LRGYRAAFAAIGVDIPDDRVVVGPASIDGGIAAMTGAWEDGLRPTAVLAMSDAMAIGAMRALRDLRLDVPGDVSVVGFDDIDLSPHVDPPLTTVHQPIRRKGEEAVRALLTVVERRGQASPEHRRLETRLIVRGSTGPVPANRAAPGSGLT